MNITEPTLLLDKAQCLRNIDAMVQKARDNGAVLRPHFKTHQSAEVGEWFRERGVEGIAVSSMRMAEYFAAAGWKDITVAFPFNVLEMARANALAANIRLNLVVFEPAALQHLQTHLQHPVQVFIKVDTGYHRTGVVPEPAAIDPLLAIIDGADLLHFKGFLAHAGHSYQARSEAEISTIHTTTLATMHRLNDAYAARYEQLALSVGDTPCCSIMDDFSGMTELRPGNFVFYDLAQHYIGSCSLDQIAVAMACPVVAKHEDRHTIIIHGGAVHFSKDQLLQNGEPFFGIVVQSNQWSEPVKGLHVASLSQEHGIIKATKMAWDQINVGDVLTILPVHSCLTANLMKGYTTLEGNQLTTM